MDLVIVNTTLRYHISKPSQNLSRWRDARKMYLWLGRLKQILACALIILETTAYHKGVANDDVIYVSKFLRLTNQICFDVSPWPPNALLTANNVSALISNTVSWFRPTIIDFRWCLVTYCNDCVSCISYLTLYTNNIPNEYGLYCVIEHDYHACMKRFLCAMGGFVGLRVYTHTHIYIYTFFVVRTISSHW